MDTATSRFVKQLFTGVMLAGMTAGNPLANPSGAQVVHGGVSISNPSATELNITNTPGAIINWEQFGIGPGELTRFIQENAASAVLNRVVGTQGTELLGS
ncbi:MAG: hypothetical protein ACR2RB_03505, partial [Gammaproteobacteria bacterium]